MNLPICDENLRLIFASEEHHQLEESLRYHMNSLLYCAGISMGFYLYLLICPVILIIWPMVGNVLIALGFLWGVGFFCCLVMVVPICFKILKYKKLQQEHEAFLKRYNRCL
ncbi:hypothetical protein [Terasakiella sp. SH-1]|uniref:hypothetical protein n=1 Tax=Terasakiella sp. SH-1 TaxID=2560057 RepID=UPI0010735E29|nr:hypothetical protein [Terasakiella sp. SH-1]